jgi:hypothetical protein
MHAAVHLCAGEYISVSSQRDAEQADIEQERLEQLKGPEVGGSCGKKPLPVCNAVAAKNVAGC